MRSHFYRPVQDSEGNILPNVQVTLYDPGTTNLITDTIYSDGTSSNVLSNPFITNNGIINIYTENPRRVRIGVVNGNQPINYLEDQDLLAAGSDSPHIGSGGHSTQVGVGGSTTGDSATAYGYNSQGSGNSGTAVGAAASAAANQGTALGAGATANGVGSTVIGNGTSAAGAGSTALGNAATAGSFVHSTAVGADAACDDDNEVAIGTAADTVFIPGAFVLKDTSGNKWQISIDTTGTLTTTAL